MKIGVILAVLFTSWTSLAETRQVVCLGNKGLSPATFGLFLDNSGINPSSRLFNLKSPFWSYAYSSAATGMTCSEKTMHISDKSSVKCIGYNSHGGLTQVSLVLENGEGTGTVHNLGEGATENIYYKETEGMTLNCQLLIR